MKTEAARMTAAAVPCPAPTRDPQENHPSWTVQNPWSPLPSHGTSFARKVFIGCSVIAVSLVVMIPVIVLFMRRVGEKFRENEPVFCETRDCVNHAHLITSGLDHEVNPCVNFASFVCGKAPKEDLYDTLRLGGITATLTRLNSSDEPKLKSSAVAMARKFFQSCVERSGREGENGLEAFKNFTGRLRIPWPAPSPKDVHPLDVLLDLSINWAVCIWINVEMYETVDGTMRVILISRCESVVTGQDRPRTDNYDHYRGYVKKYCDLFRGDEPCMQNAEQLQKDESFAWNSLAANRSAYYPVVFTLEEINQFTPSIPSKVWIDLLNKHFKPSYPFSNYLVLARDARALTAMSEVFAKLSAERALTQIAWAFVQKYAWIAMPQATSFPPSSAQTGDQRNSACLAAVEDIVGLLLRAGFIHSTFPEPEREKIDHVFDNITNVTLGYVQNAGWLSQEQIVVASVKFSSTQRNAWPASEFFNVTALDALYSDFPSMTEDFFSNWILSRQALVSNLKNRTYKNGQLYDKRYDTVYGLFSLLNYINVIEVSLSALQGPLYYSQGTAAINYGGLGGRYAMEFLKCLYDTFRWPAEMNPEDEALARLFPRNNARPPAPNVPTCILQGSKPHPLFPLAPALQVAHKAFKREQRLRTSDPNMDFKLASLKEYTADNLFFLSFCRTLCHALDLCNVAVSNFAPFATAFKCPQGTAMNPAEKCSFFQEWPRFHTWDSSLRRWSR